MIYSLKPKFQQKEYAFVTKLFNSENCVILAQIRFNLNSATPAGLKFLTLWNKADYLAFPMIYLSCLNYDYKHSYTRFSKVSK